MRLHYGMYEPLERRPTLPNGFAELVTGTPSPLVANLSSLNGREQRSCLGAKPAWKREKPAWKRAQWNGGKRLMTFFKLLDPAVPNSPQLCPFVSQKVSSPLEPDWPGFLLLTTRRVLVCQFLWLLDVMT